MYEILDDQRTSFNQIMKLIICFNIQTGRACLGDVIYRYITSEQFSSECLLDCLDLSSEHAALDMANRVEAAIYVWRRRQNNKHTPHPSHSAAKSSWEMVKDLMTHGDKRELLAERGKNLLQSLKQRFPGLTQTTLDATKIQHNKVGSLAAPTIYSLFESLVILNSLYLLLFCTSGCGEIHLGELLEGVGEFSIQHCSTNRGPTLRGRHKQ